MNYNETKETMKLYLLARIPFIAFNTIEKSRGVELLKELSIECNLDIDVYSMSKGLINIKTNEKITDEKSLIGILDYIGNEIKLKENKTYVLTDFPNIDSENINTSYLCDIVSNAEEKNCAIVVLTDSNVYQNLQRMGISLAMDLPNEEELYDFIHSYINQYKNNLNIEWDEDDYKNAAVVLLGISLVEAKNVISALIAKGNITKQDLIDLKFAKDKMFSNINGLEKIEIDKDTAFAGLNNLKKWLDDKKKLQSPTKKAEMKKRGIKPPRGILMVGIPGCGKSLAAKAVASRWELPLYLLDFATVQGQYVGQSERQLKEALETAERVSPCILWIDEIEKGLSGNKSDSGVTTRMIGQFLFWLQECKKEVFVVATANDTSSLPPELLRKGRFDEMFFVDLPNTAERKEIINFYLAKYLNVSVNETLMEKLISITEGFSGADIETSLRDIAYSVVSDNISLTEELILNKLSKVIPLTKSNPTIISKIREWGKDKTISAS